MIFNHEMGIFMDAVTVTHAEQNLNHLIEQVISNVEPTIICNDKGERALLMSLDEASLGINPKAKS